MSQSVAMNIGPREQRKRRLMGIVALTIGVALAFLLVVTEAPRLWRLVIFFPIWMAALGLFQSRAKICIAHAARGTCNMDDGDRPLFDARFDGELRRQAKTINRRALVTAGVITVVALIFPG